MTDEQKGVKIIGGKRQELKTGVKIQSAQTREHLEPKGVAVESARDGQGK